MHAGGGDRRDQRWWPPKLNVSTPSIPDRFAHAILPGAACHRPGRTPPGGSCQQDFDMQTGCSQRLPCTFDFFHGSLLRSPCWPMPLVGCHRPWRTPWQTPWRSAEQSCQQDFEMKTGCSHSLPSTFYFCRGSLLRGPCWPVPPAGCHHSWPEPGRIASECEWASALSSHCLGSPSVY